MFFVRPVVAYLLYLFVACAKDSGSFVRPVKGILTTSKTHLQYLYVQVMRAYLQLAYRLDVSCAHFCTAFAVHCSRNNAASIACAFATREQATNTNVLKVLSITHDANG